MRTQPPTQPHSPSWEIHDEFEGHERGDEFTFKDVVTTKEGNTLHRRARFIRYVTSPRGDWLDCVQVSKGDTVGGRRSIDPSRISKWWKRTKTSPTPKTKRKMRKEGDS